MKVSKFLSTAVATATVVGAIGIAYAQTGMDKGGAEAPAATPPSTTTAPPAASPSTPDSGMAGERAPRADRG